MFVEYPKRFAVTLKPPSGREGDRRLTTVEGERDRTLLCSERSCGVEDGDDHNSDVGKDAEPHICKSQGDEREASEFDRK